jgi:8-oxo-dGTP diphosphatase
MSFERSGEKHFTASVLVENRGAFLLLYHPRLEMWLYPGGHVEPNEEPQEAALRELEEEVAISAELLSCGAAPEMRLDIDPGSVAELPVPLAVLSEMIPNKGGGHHWHIDMIYIARAGDDQRARLSNSDEYRWVSSDQAQHLKCPRELPSLMRRAQSFLRHEASRSAANFAIDRPDVSPNIV